MKTHFAAQRKALLVYEFVTNSPYRKGLLSETYLAWHEGPMQFRNLARILPLEPYATPSLLCRALAIVFIGINLATAAVAGVSASEAKWKQALNQAWSKLTSEQQKTLEPEQRKWVKWKNALPDPERLQATKERTEYIIEYRNTPPKSEQLDDEQIIQILKTEVLPHYKTEDGLRVPPEKVDYLLSPKLRQMDEKSPTFWKAMLSPVNRAYVEIQGPINDKNRPRLSQELRGLLNHAFDQFMSFRGGGSASVALSAQAPAQTEWIIRELKSDFEDPLLFKDNVRVREEIRDKVVNQNNIDRLLHALPFTGLGGDDSYYQQRVEDVLNRLANAVFRLSPSHADLVTRMFLSYLDDQPLY